MAVYKIFPEKDTTVYSAYPLTNTGFDQILEIQNEMSSSNNSAQVSRFLITFPTSQIQDVINNEVTGTYRTFLKLFVANATSLPDDYTLNFYAVSQSWEEGTGRFLYNPADINGSSWVQRNNNINWRTSSFAVNSTGSYQTDSPGGGTWYTNIGSYQSFVINNTKDVNADVTNIITQFYTGSITNNGILVKMDNYEYNPSSSYSLKYFSRNTHTIYPPQLEIRWDDSKYVTGSLSVLSNDNTVITLGNNIGQYNTDTVYNFRVNARPTYPTRQFVTQSVYTLNSALPSSSYYAVQDLDTGEYVIDFDTSYTKLSCDSAGNYFILYMAGLQPQRYYKVLIKSSFNDGSTVVYDNNYIFKINK
jgi:hypothetical protein